MPVAWALIQSIRALLMGSSRNGTETELVFFVFMVVWFLLGNSIPSLPIGSRGAGTCEKGGEGLQAGHWLRESASAGNETAFEWPPEGQDKPVRPVFPCLSRNFGSCVFLPIAAESGNSLSPLDFYSVMSVRVKAGGSPSRHCHKAGPDQASP